MPHVTMEYSANLDAKLDMAALCAAVADAALATGIFEIGAVRVRAVRCDAYAIADRLPENAFLDAVLKMGQGRSAEDRKRLGEALFETLQARTAHLLAEPHFALTLQLREIDDAFSWKRNAIHPRTREAVTDD